MSASVGKVYSKLLWLAGFLNGENLTKMMARSKERLGPWWWVLAIGTVVIGLGFVIWLIYHVATYRSRNKKRPPRKEG